MNFKLGLLTVASALAFSLPVAAEDSGGADTGMGATGAGQSYDTGTGTGMDSPATQTDAMDAGESSVENMDFSALDANGDGMVTEEEFLDNNQDLADAGDVFNQIDENTDGNVTEDEFDTYAEGGTTGEDDPMGGWFDE